jgi:hypothetical protein
MTTPKKSEPLNDTIIEVTERIGGRSASARGEYLERTRKRKLIEPARGKLACANLAHVMAASAKTRRSCSSPSFRTSASSPRTTTCCRRIGRSNPIPR